MTMSEVDTSLTRPSLKQVQVLYYHIKSGLKYFLIIFSPVLEIGHMVKNTRDRSHVNSLFMLR